MKVLGPLTRPQRLALVFLQRWGRAATPAQIGAAMTPGRKYPLKPQGAGRIGGAMAKRLIAMGLVRDASREHGGFPAYEVSPEGIRVVAQIDAAYGAADDKS